MTGVAVDLFFIHPIPDTIGRYNSLFEINTAASQHQYFQLDGHHLFDTDRIF